MLFGTAQQWGSGARSFPRSFITKDRPGSWDVES